MSVSRNGIVTALDVGSSKVCCLIARPDGHGGTRVIGIGHQLSAGIRGGAVVDMEAAEDAIRAAVDAAERMAGETVRGVYVNLSGGHPASHTVGVEVAIAGHQIGDGDVRRVLQQAQAKCEPGENQVLHAIPTGFTIDTSRGIRDPRGMYGDRLGVNLHIVTAAASVMRNLATVTERCHLDVEGFVASAYASALSALVEDEMDLGVTLLEMGGGTTSMAVFYDGSIVHTDVLSVGGGHVTSDIARGLSTPTAHAERMKTLYGSAIAGPTDELEMVSVPQVGESASDTNQQVPRSTLIGIIQPRIEETLELVRERLKNSGFDGVGGRRLVLTGGGSQLTGVRELAGRVLNKQVRIGRPLKVHGLAEAMDGPAFSTAAGLLAYAIRGPKEVRETVPALAAASAGRLERIGRWLRQNF